ncbi:MAG: GNAT family N-acetyltransferase [Defluviitaleaceae bacterium]|nr:GNAT family N-acetyltransferase [Defluviitaleaceae bacterium]
MVEIKEIGLDDLEQVFPIICQLRPHLGLDECRKLIGTMIPAGYQMFCLFNKGQAAAYAGIAVMTNLYHKKHIWVYELVTDHKMRSQGFGGLLLSFIEEYAKKCAADCVVLASGLQRTDAHKFYEQTMDYEKVSYIYKKEVG